MSRPAEFYQRAIEALNAAIAASWQEENPEEAVRHFTRATREILGDRAALQRPDALKPGETQFVVSGCFYIAPPRDHMILLATNGLMEAQRFARISVTDSRPGHTVQTRTPAVVPNTDDDAIFRQIISSGRVGCSVYVPMMWRNEVIGMFNTAAQARYFYDEIDLSVQRLFANAAAASWMGLGGPAYIERLAAKLGPWPSA